eukprot:gb/GEZN01016362.1/.p1 GENE.gb/GEZN01016362.1/~~gb/GEZN01016362.1/.p1  ORF type:complete len:261 (-),score=20.21 gb/GEZN01016362.1/:34-816(-)
MNSKQKLVTATLTAAALASAVYIYYYWNGREGRRRRHWRVEVRNGALRPSKAFNTPPVLIEPPSAGQRVQLPSPSQVVNNVSALTGVSIPPECCSAFDSDYFAEMTAHFAALNKSAELEEYLSTGRSNGRPLLMQLMVLPPNTWFKMHAHPNIEMMFLLAGKMSELRATHTADGKALALDPADPSKTIRGPALPASTVLQLRTYCQGSYLANEVGSIHQSFTNPAGGVLLVLWSGCHANITAEDCRACTDVRMRPHVGLD